MKLNYQAVFVDTTCASSYNKITYSTAAPLFKLNQLALVECRLNVKKKKDREVNTIFIIFIYVVNLFMVIRFGKILKGM